MLIIHDEICKYQLCASLRKHDTLETPTTTLCQPHTWPGSALVLQATAGETSQDQFFVSCQGIWRCQEDNETGIL